MLNINNSSYGRDLKYFQFQCNRCLSAIASSLFCCYWISSIFTNFDLSRLTYIVLIIFYSLFQWAVMGQKNRKTVQKFFWRFLQVKKDIYAVKMLFYLKRKNLTLNLNSSKKTRVIKCTSLFEIF